MHPEERTVGHLLRDWRQRRHLSQLALAGEAEISTRHLSFLETGRARPSREMVLRLAERLDVPLRERNELLVAAGFAPRFPERPLSDPALTAARAAVDIVLAGHEPYPALAVDRHWTLVAANRAVGPMMAAVGDPSLVEPPVNVLRVSLHPNGLAPRLVNLMEWRGHVLARLRRQVDLTADPVLAALWRELRDYPAPGEDEDDAERAPGTGVVIPFRMATDAGVLSFFSTTTIFGTPVDVTLSELAIESFFPADRETEECLRALGSDPRRD